MGEGTDLWIGKSPALNASTLQKYVGAFGDRQVNPWWVFGVAGVMAITLTLVTISIQTISAALANPVKYLHAE